MRLRFVAVIAIACSAVLVACGGPNESKNQRLGDRNAASADEDPIDEEDLDGGEAEDAAMLVPEPTQPTDDAGASEAAAPVPEGSFAAGTDLETTADLNLRDGPGTDFAVLLTMPAGSLVKVQTISGADGWVHVDYQGTVGYASKTYLKAP